MRMVTMVLMALDPSVLMESMVSGVMLVMVTSLAILKHTVHMHNQRKLPMEVRLVDVDCGD